MLKTDTFCSRAATNLLLGQRGVDGGDGVDPGGVEARDHAVVLVENKGLLHAAADRPLGTVDVLKAWRKRQLEERMAYGAGWTDTGHVFTREDGSPHHPDRVSKMFNRAVAAADLPRIPVHGLRHTSASVALASGVPLKVVSDRLGHSSIAITGDVYSHVTAGQDRDAAETIANRMMGGS